MKIYLNETENARQLERKMQLVQTNRKVIAKGGRLKRYCDETKQYR